MPPPQILHKVSNNFRAFDLPFSTPFSRSDSFNKYSEITFFYKSFEEVESLAKDFFLLKNIKLFWFLIYNRNKIFFVLIMQYDIQKHIYKKNRIQFRIWIYFKGWTLLTLLLAAVCGRSCVPHDTIAIYIILY